MISSTRLDRSYQVIPGAAISGVLGSFTGPNVVADGGNRVRYFHYNDMGTVMAQTRANATVEGVWEPDWWGNYRWAYSGSPARPELGLTGKMYDDAAGLYYFNARWYDPERGRWMSREPISLFPRYDFCSSHPSGLADPSGMVPFFTDKYGVTHDLDWPECSLENIFGDCQSGCNYEGRIKQLVNSVRKVATLLQGKEIPGPETVEDVRSRAGGVTPPPYDVAYFNPDGPTRRNACVAFCICIHEWTHVALFAAGMGGTTALESELLPYIAEGICAGALMQHSLF